MTGRPLILVPAHHFLDRRLALGPQEVLFRHDADQVLLVIEHRHVAQVAAFDDLQCLLDRGLLADGDGIGRHPFHY